MMNVHNWIERAAARYYPPGLGRKSFTGNAVLILSFPVIVFLFQLLVFLNELEDLYTWVGGHRILRMDARLWDFADLFQHGCSGVYASVLAALVLAAQNYWSFRQESMSVYLMRRLPDRWDYPRRCLALPLAGTAAALCESVLLYVLLNLIYRFFTPAGCLGDPALALWRAFL